MSYVIDGAKVVALLAGSVVAFGVATLLCAVVGAGCIAALRMVV